MRIQSNPLSQFSPADLHFYLEELLVSLPPPPTGGRAAQVAVLEAAGLEDAARAVTGCGATVKIDEWNCGTKRQGETIHAHRYGCCKGCDRHVMTKLLDEHKKDDRKIPRGGTWQRYWLEAEESDATEESLERVLNDVSLVRKWVGNGHDGRLKVQHDGKRWVARGLVWLAPGRQLPAPPSSINLKPPLPGWAFHEAQAWVLTPLLKEAAQGELRGHIMVAAHGRNLFRSYGRLLGVNAGKREENAQGYRPPTPDTDSSTGVGPSGIHEDEEAQADKAQGEKLRQPPTRTPDVSCTGVGQDSFSPANPPIASSSSNTDKVHPRDFCPIHGPRCPKRRSYTLLTSEAENIPKDDRYETISARCWREMQEALKSVEDYDLAVSQLPVAPSEQFSDELFRRVFPTYCRLAALGRA